MVFYLMQFQFTFVFPEFHVVTTFLGIRLEKPNSNQRPSPCEMGIALIAFPLDCTTAHDCHFTKKSKGSVDYTMQYSNLLKNKVRANQKMFTTSRKIIGN